MFTLIGFILISIVFSLLISFPITNFLYKYNIVRSGEYDDTYSQIPTRKEKQGTPIMGGLIIVLTVIIITAITNISRSYTLLPISVLTLCAIIGALDDILNIYGRKRPVRQLRHTIKLALHHAKPIKRVYFMLLTPWSAYKTLFYKFGSRLGSGLHPHEKILVQAFAGGIIAFWVYVKLDWTLIWLPGGRYLNIGWLVIPFIIILVIFMANAVNITDGMDGLSAGTLISSYMVFMTIAFLMHNNHIAYLCAVTVGALITYTYFNIKPARFEMGDVGSLALGAMLATIAILLHKEVILFFCGMIYIIEIGSVIIQKIYKIYTGKKLFLMTPLHHHLELMGWSEEKVVMRLWVFSIVFALISLWVFSF